MGLVKTIKKQFQALLAQLFVVDMGVDSPYFRDQMMVNTLQSNRNAYFERKQSKLEQRKALRRQKRLS